MSMQGDTGNSMGEAKRRGWLERIRWVEAHRLSLALASPEYRINRIDELTIREGGERYAWNVRQVQLIPPVHAKLALAGAEQHDDGGTADEDRLRQRIVSLGLFPKHRIPDLVASDCTGREIPVLDRRDRVSVMVQIVLGRYALYSYNRVKEILTDPEPRNIDGKQYMAAEVVEHVRRDLIPDAEVPPGSALRDVDPIEIAGQPYYFRYPPWLDQGVTLIMTRGSGTAREVFRALAIALEHDIVWRFLAAETGFLNDLWELVEHTHVLARVTANPGEHLIINYSHDDPYRFLANAPSVFDDDVLLSQVLRYGYERLGLVPRYQERRAKNISRHESYHLIVHAPSGMTVEGLYWKYLKPLHADEFMVNYERGNTASVSLHADDAVTDRNGIVRVGLQLAGGGAAKKASAYLLGAAVALFYLSWLVARGVYVPEQDGVSQELGGLIIGLPGVAIAGAANLRAGMTGYLTSWLRALVTLAGLAPLLVGLVLAFDTSDRLVRLLASLAGAACLGVGLMVTYVAWANRWPGMVRWDIRRCAVQRRWERTRENMTHLAGASACLVTMITARLAHLGATWSEASEWIIIVGLATLVFCLAMRNTGGSDSPWLHWYQPGALGQPPSDDSLSPWLLDDV